MQALAVECRRSILQTARKRITTGSQPQYLLHQTSHLEEAWLGRVERWYGVVVGEVEGKGREESVGEVEGGMKVVL
jgi:hypothetical protein